MRAWEVITGIGNRRRRDERRRSFWRYVRRLGNCSIREGGLKWVIKFWYGYFFSFYLTFCSRKFWPLFWLFFKARCYWDFFWFFYFLILLAPSKEKNSNEESWGRLEVSLRYLFLSPPFFLHPPPSVSLRSFSLLHLTILVSHWISCLFLEQNYFLPFHILLSLYFPLWFGGFFRFFFFFPFYVIGYSRVRSAWTWNWLVGNGLVGRLEMVGRFPFPFYFL